MGEKSYKHNDNTDVYIGKSGREFVRVVQDVTATAFILAPITVGYFFIDNPIWYIPVLALGSSLNSWLAMNYYLEYRVEP